MVGADFRPTLTQSVHGVASPHDTRGPARLVPCLKKAGVAACEHEASH
jgi:hypothetical protein